MNLKEIKRIHIAKRKAELEFEYQQLENQSFKDKQTLNKMRKIKGEIAKYNEILRIEAEKNSKATSNTFTNNQEINGVKVDFRKQNKK